MLASSRRRSKAGRLGSRSCRAETRSTCRICSSAASNSAKHLWPTGSLLQIRQHGLFGDRHLIDAPLPPLLGGEFVPCQPQVGTCLPALLLGVRQPGVLQLGQPLTLVAQAVLHRGPRRLQQVQVGLALAGGLGQIGFRDCLREHGRFAGTGAADANLQDVRDRSGFDAEMVAEPGQRVVFPANRRQGRHVRPAQYRLQHDRGRNQGRLRPLKAGDLVFAALLSRSRGPRDRDAHTDFGAVLLGQETPQQRGRQSAGQQTQARSEQPALSKCFEESARERWRRDGHRFGFQLGGGSVARGREGRGGWVGKGRSGG